MRTSFLGILCLAVIALVPSTGLAQKGKVRDEAARFRFHLGDDGSKSATRGGDERVKLAVVKELTKKTNATRTAKDENENGGGKNKKECFTRRGSEEGGDAVGIWGRGKLATPIVEGSVRDFELGSKSRWEAASER